MTGADAKRGMEVGFVFSGGNGFAGCACMVVAMTKDARIRTKARFIVVAREDFSRKAAKAQSAAAFQRTFFPPLRLCAFARNFFFRLEWSRQAPLAEFDRDSTDTAANRVHAAAVVP